MGVRFDVRTWAVRLATVTAVLLMAPAAAQANGPCGQDSSGNSACPVTFPSTQSGLLVTSNESDYYVFSAEAGQEIFATITDTESPNCSNSYSCGEAQAGLYDASGNSVGPSTGNSQPNNGVTVPRSFAWTVQTSGTYYLIVEGNLGTDSNNNPTSVPYTLALSDQSSPCGYSFQTVGCSVNSPATLTGSLKTSDQSDYYALYVQPNTELSVTVTDNESPGCSNNYSCGDAQAALYDASGNSVGPSTGSSQPNNGITVPQSFRYTVGSRGVYYIEVDGDLGTDSNNNPTQVPYSLQVSASPNVTWPPPAPTTTQHPTPPPRSGPKPHGQSPKLVLGRVRHFGHTVRLSVKLGRGRGRLTADAVSGRRHRKVRVSRHGRFYNLSTWLPRGRWMIRVRFVGAKGWLTATLQFRVRVR